MGIFESRGTPEEERLLSSLMSPPRTMDSPDATTTLVWAERENTSGFGFVVVIEPGSAELTSWLTSSVTSPPELIRGVTARRTPVSRYWKLLTTPPAVLSPVCCETWTEILD